MAGLNMSWDDFKAKHLFNDQPKMSDYFKMKWAETESIPEPVTIETYPVQFQLERHEDWKANTHNYMLSWVADGLKYGIQFVVSKYYELDLIHDPTMLGDMMVKQFTVEMEKAGRPWGEIKCMENFIFKLVFNENKSHYVSETYNYLPEPKKSYHSGGWLDADEIAISFDGIKGKGAFIGNSGPNHNYRQPEVDLLPGIKEIVKHPVTGVGGTIESIIISLNDAHRWTRDQIADWLETLGVDLTFKEQPEKRPGRQDEIPAGTLTAKDMHIEFKLDLDKIDYKALEMLYGGKLPAISKKDALEALGLDPEKEEQ